MSEQICPVWSLPDFDRNHWDFQTLCEHFNCKVCVAAFEDFGIYPEDEDKETVEEVWPQEIPF